MAVEKPPTSTPTPDSIVAGGTRAKTSSANPPSISPFPSETWDRFVTELDAWAAADQIATFWWRDDDAVQPGPKLERLIELTASSGLLLAVIPAQAQPSLVPWVESSTRVYVAQHGYSHTNHAERGRGLGAWELGLHRPAQVVVDEMLVGRERLSEMFGIRFLPVVVPPWNHIDPALLSPLAAQGYCGVSLFGADNADPLPQHFVRANAHCDPIKWKGGARFTGEIKAMDQLLNHLQQRRSGQADINEATGILTHHIDMDEASWDFCSRIETLISQHAAAQWCSAAELFEIKT